MIVILDSNILGLLTAPIRQNSSNEAGLITEAYRCTEWFYRLLSKGAYIVSADICDYEIRREFIFIKSESIQLLDDLRNLIDFKALSPDVLKQAARIWAEMRSVSQPNTSRENIDVDVILSAHWYLLKEEFPGRKVTIATKNVKDFQRIAECEQWEHITY